MQSLTETPVILVGIGGNMRSRVHGPPLRVCQAALGELESEDISVVRRSRWYRTSPVPRSGQPWFVNGVAEIVTDLGPEALLARLHAIERAFGRRRGEPNAARTLDLDLLAFGPLVRTGAEAPLLPHPRLAERAFVLVPLAEFAPEWRHPATGRTVREMAAMLPSGQVVEPIPEGDPEAWNDSNLLAERRSALI